MNFPFSPRSKHRDYINPRAILQKEGATKTPVSLLNPNGIAYLSGCKYKSNFLIKNLFEGNFEKNIPLLK
jgi:hypothetical protein